ncbi:hypothetical protein [Paraburkholderia terrae]|uniref:hypothetical protein n=1 Tax=Paraburkholderia terrae TaxID=311230 RepID=UPI001E62F796|nr:hypothetical protein [Paraburkholderia terrae]
MRALSSFGVYALPFLPSGCLMRCFKYPLSPALRLMSRAMLTTACLAVPALGTHAQMLSDLSNHSALKSPLVQTLSQKRHKLASTDPYIALIEKSDPYYRLHGKTADASASDQTGLPPLGTHTGMVQSMVRASPLQSSASLPTRGGFSVRSTQLGSRIAGATLPGMSADSTLTGCLLAVPSSSMPSVLSSCR